LEGFSSGKLDIAPCKNGTSSQMFEYDGKLHGLIDGSAATRMCLTAAASGGGGAEVVEYGDGVAFLSNMDDNVTKIVTYKGKQYVLPNHTVVILDKTGVPLFNSSELEPSLPLATKPTPTAPLQPGQTLLGGRVATAAVQTTPWSYYQERAGVGAKSAAGAGGVLVDQLHWTGGQAAVDGSYGTDYLWSVCRMRAAFAPHVRRMFAHVRSRSPRSL
jgi:hypothetical protein